MRDACCVHNRGVKLDHPVFDYSCLIGQFVVSAAENRAPSPWISDRVGDWFLGRHPALPVIQLLAAEGRPLGWMLGYPISEDGRLLSNGETLKLPVQTLASTEALEAFIYSFGGRFAVAVLDPRQPRFYLDSYGSLSAVYCAHQRMVASTPNLIPYDEHSGDRVELIKAIGFPYRQGSYPLGLTPRYAVERILPNHYLDLSDFRTVRHWPRQPLAEGAPVAEAVAEIATLVKRNIAAVVANTPTYLRLTAGQDSRMLLACARGVADRLELITAEIGDDLSSMDCDIAKRIARRLGLKHHVLPMKTATESDLQEWLFRVSNSVGQVRGWQSATTFKSLAGGHANLLGIGGELARGYWWQDDYTGTTAIGPQRLIELCNCPVMKEPLARARAWLETVPAGNTFQTLDLFMVEQDCGCWAGVFPYADADSGFMLFPLCHRPILERMLTLPVSYRRSGRLPRDIIAREWPALLEWPMNQPTGLMSLRFRLNRAISKCARLLRLAREGAMGAIANP